MARVLDNGAGATTADQRDAARVIRTSGEALRFLVEDILDLSRLEAGKTIIASADVPIHRELSETATVFAHQAEEKGLRLAVVLDPMVPPVVTLDWPHVRQIVINIIANAIKFTEQGHVIVRLAAETASEESRRLVLTVEDTGIGISPDDMSRIFEPFAQADDGVNRRFDGSGLGLAISAELAKAMNGTLDVESTPGKGSCFRLSLPLIVGGTLAPVSDVEPAPLLADAAAAPLLAAAGIAHTVPAGGPGPWPVISQRPTGSAHRRHAAGAADGGGRCKTGAPPRGGRSGGRPSCSDRRSRPAASPCQCSRDPEHWRCGATGNVA